jgi:hypothetical protein
MSDDLRHDDSAARMARDFLAEMRQRLSDPADLSLAARLAPAVSRLTDRLIIVACDRLTRGDMWAFFETVLEGMTEEERTAWRTDLTSDWFQAADTRWRRQQALRREIVEAILLIKALALA